MERTACFTGIPIAEARQICLICRVAKITRTQVKEPSSHVSGHLAITVDLGDRATAFWLRCRRHRILSIHARNVWRGFEAEVCSTAERSRCFFAHAGGQASARFGRSQLASMSSKKTDRWRLRTGTAPGNVRYSGANWAWHDDDRFGLGCCVINSLERPTFLICSSKRPCVRQSHGPAEGMPIQQRETRFSGREICPIYSSQTGIQPRSVR